jgi:uncharacterized membrane protein YqhA
VLKVKLAMAIIGISSIHLLKTFIAIGSLGVEDSDFTVNGVMWQTAPDNCPRLSTWCIASRINSARPH